MEHDPNVRRAGVCGRPGVWGGLCHFAASHDGSCCPMEEGALYRLLGLDEPAAPRTFA